MTLIRHTDFEPPNWGEFAQPPKAWDAYAARTMAMNPLGYWRLGEASGSTAADQTGTRDGTYVGPVNLGQPGALHRDPDTATGFNGTNASLGLPDTTFLNGASQATIAFWMNYRAPAVTKDGAVIGRWPDPSGDGWLVWVDERGFITNRYRTLTVSFRTSDSTSGRIEGSTDLITPGVWSFFAMTFVGNGQAALYRDGELDRTAAVNYASMPSLTAPVRVGRSGGTIGHLPAWLDELAVFNTALTADQVRELYDLGRGHLKLPMGGV